jgi:hypothetical protein
MTRSAKTPPFLLLADLLLGAPDKILRVLLSRSACGERAGERGSLNLSCTGGFSLFTFPLVKRRGSGMLCRETKKEKRRWRMAARRTPSG